MHPLVLALSFLCVASFKFFAAMSENAFVPAALMFAAMFGAPQLIWLWFLRKGPINDDQTRVAHFTLAAFVFSSILFGYFPGESRPTWGGEGHFEVPAAFLLEGLITIIGVVVFVARGKGANTGAA